MKRSPIKRKRDTPRRSGHPLRTGADINETSQGKRYEREFEKMKPKIRGRSKSVCETRSVIAAKAKTVDLDNDFFETSLFEWARGSHCTGRGEHIHHVQYRGRGGKNTMNNLIDICNGCHHWIHHNETFSEALGLSRRSGEASQEIELTGE